MRPFYPIVHRASESQSHRMNVRNRRRKYTRVQIIKRLSIRVRGVYISTSICIKRLTSVSINQSINRLTPLSPHASHHLPPPTIPLHNPPPIPPAPTPHNLPLPLNPAPPRTATLALQPSQINRILRPLLAVLANAHAALNRPSDPIAVRSGGWELGVGGKGGEGGVAIVGRCCAVGRGC